MSSTTFLLLTTLLLTTPPPTEPLLFSTYPTLITLSHSLITRVANLRAARGDHAGAARARQLSNTIQQGLSFNFFKSIFTLGYDFLINYAFNRETYTLGPIVAELSELMSSLTEFTKMDTPEQMDAWLKSNQRKLTRVTRGLLDRLVNTFSRNGPLKEVFEALKKEVVDGELLKDCLHLGSDDLVGVVKIVTTSPGPRLPCIDTAVKPSQE